MADTEADNKIKHKNRFKIELIIYIIAIVFSVYFFPKYVVQRTVVDGNSMLNTLHDKEHLIMEKVSYRFHDPKRFDIAVFYPYGREDGRHYVKRIIGLPGETIQIKDSDIYINGTLLYEDYGKEPMIFSGIATEPLTLSEDEFFVLGDNRNESYDSRYAEIGPVNRKNLCGRIVFRIYPFDRFGLIKSK